MGATTLSRCRSEALPWASVAYDREAARQAFEAALALSPSCAITYILGSVVMAFDGDADRGIEWGERALRLSPFDPMSYAPWFSMTFGHFQRGDYEAAAEAARKVFQANPYWSSAHVLLAATHAKLGRLEAAKSDAAPVLELEPGYTISGMCAALRYPTRRSPHPCAKRSPPPDCRHRFSRLMAASGQSRRSEPAAPASA
jgi:tetratricopeptide (TPR) repeat protein